MAEFDPSSAQTVPLAIESAELLANVRDFYSRFAGQIDNLKIAGATEAEHEALQSIIEDAHSIGRLATGGAFAAEASAITINLPEEVFAVDSAEAYEAVRDFVYSRGSGVAFTMADLRSHLEALNVTVPDKDSRLLNQLHSWQKEIREELLEDNRRASWQEVSIDKVKHYAVIMSTIKKGVKQPTIPTTIGEHPPVVPDDTTVPAETGPLADESETVALALFADRRLELGKNWIRRGPLVTRLADALGVGEHRAGLIFDSAVAKGILHRDTKDGSVLFSDIVPDQIADTDVRPQPESAPQEPTENDKRIMKAIVAILHQKCTTDGTALTLRELSESLLAAGHTPELLDEKEIKKYGRALLRQNVVVSYRSNQSSGGTKFTLGISVPMRRLLNKPAKSSQLYELIDSGDNFTPDSFDK